MKKITKRVMALALVAMLSTSTAFIAKEKKCFESKAIAGVGYLAAKKGASAEAGLAISLAGVYEGAVQGACWGAAFGGVVGTVAGVTVGL